MRNTGRRVTIIMYHYVRDLKHSRYPGIKGLDIAHFEEQIEYLKKHYHFITMEMLIDAIDSDSPLPEKSVLLTFDDGYEDHFNFVFPLLNRHNIQGCFYPPVKAISEHTVLDVNKIHFILASVEDKSKIISVIREELDSYRDEYKLESYSAYYDKLAKPSRYDPADVVFIKRLLQRELEETVRKKITNNLFEKIVGIDEDSFSRELYMDVEQIKCMARNGMHIGAHGFDHYWLGSLTREQQQWEIEKSIEFLQSIGCAKDWTMCYPYGNYNSITIELLAQYGCKLALTTNVDIAEANKKDRYTLPRLDTTDMPVNRNTQTNKWYEKG